MPCITSLLMLFLFGAHTPMTSSAAFAALEEPLEAAIAFFLAVPISPSNIDSSGCKVEINLVWGYIVSPPQDDGEMKIPKIADDLSIRSPMIGSFGVSGEPSKCGPSAAATRL